MIDFFVFCAVICARVRVDFVPPEEIMLDIIGSIGGLLLGVCALPETWHVIRSKKSSHSWPFLGLWGIGDLCLLAYGIGAHLPLAIVLNNILNAVCIGTIVYYKSTCAIMKT